MLIYNNMRPFTLFAVLSLPIPILLGMRLIQTLSILNISVFLLSLLFVFIIFKLYYYDGGEMYLKLKEIEYHNGDDIYTIPYQQLYLDVQDSTFGWLGYKVVFLIHETLGESTDSQNTVPVYTLVLQNDEQLHNLCRFLVGAYPDIVHHVEGIIIDVSDEEIKKLHENVVKYFEKK